MYFLLRVYASSSLDILQRLTRNAYSDAGLNGWCVTRFNGDPLISRLMAPKFTLNKPKLLRDVNSLAVRGVYLPPIVQEDTHKRSFFALRQQKRALETDVYLSQRALFRMVDRTKTLEQSNYKRLHKCG